MAKLFAGETAVEVALEAIQIHGGYGYIKDYPVERFFRELTDKALRRGVFLSVPDLIAKIEEYLNAHNAKGTTFIWTATADQILAKVARGRVALEKSINHETHH